MIWTAADINKLVSKGMVSESNMKVVNFFKNVDIPIGIQFIENTLEKNGINFEKEKMLVKNRKFRSDYYFELNGKKVAVEYEGIYSDVSRHTNFKGYNNDTIKYNLIALQGIICLRYTAGTYKDFEADIKTILK